MHGLSDSVGILGPIPNGWKAIIKGDALGRQTQRFVRISDHEETLDDPRLPLLPSNWERIMYERGPDDPTVFERFRNLETDEIVNYDPRLVPEVLETLGVELQPFELI